MSPSGSLALMLISTFYSDSCTAQTNQNSRTYLEDCSVFDNDRPNRWTTPESQFQNSQAQFKCPQSVHRVLQVEKLETESRLLLEQISQLVPKSVLIEEKGQAKFALLQVKLEHLVKSTAEETTLWEDEERRFVVNLESETSLQKNKLLESSRTCRITIEIEEGEIKHRMEEMEKSLGRLNEILNILSSTTQPSLEMPEDTTQPSMEMPEDTTQPSMEMPEDTTQPSMEMPEDTTQPSLEMPEDTTQPAMEMPQDTTQPSLEMPQDTTQPSLEMPQDTTQHFQTNSNPNDHVLKTSAVNTQDWKLGGQHEFSVKKAMGVWYHIEKFERSSRSFSISGCNEYRFNLRGTTIQVSQRWDRREDNFSWTPDTHFPYKWRDEHLNEWKATDYNSWGLFVWCNNDLLSSCHTLFIMSRKRTLSPPTLEMLRNSVGKFGFQKDNGFLLNQTSC